MCESHDHAHTPSNGYTLNLRPITLKGAGWLNLSSEIGSLGVAFDYESVFGLVPKT